MQTIWIAPADKPETGNPLANSRLAKRLNHFHTGEDRARNSNKDYKLLQKTNTTQTTSSTSYLRRI